MPVAAYRTTLGVAKDAVNTTLSAAVAAGATSIPIVGTGVAASSTITFVDGPLTESRAVSGGGGTSTLTVSALTNAHSANCYVTSQLTAALGPLDYIPVTVLDVEDQIIQLKDKGYRGSAVTEYDNVQGTRYSVVTIGGDVIIDTFPWFVGSVTGAVDFSGGTPNTHAFSVKNTSDSQPTALTFWDFNAIDTRIYPGARVEELALKYDPSGLLTYTAKMNSWMSGPVSNLTASYSAIPVSAAWQCQASIGGTAVLIVMNADVTIKRAVNPVYTLQGIQDPYKMWMGPQEVSGSMTVVMEDNTQLNNFLNNSKPALDLLWTASGANPATLKYHMTKCNFESAKPTIGSMGFYELPITFRAVANTTDATTAGTGYAPIKVTAGNAVATGRYT